MKNSKPKVSVVTITYAHEKYIEDTLRGVLMQQYDGPIEFIIANDNSPDQTDEVVKKFFDTHPIPENIEIKYTCHQENKGMMPNFIWALEQATGEYIALCEGDDYWTDPLKLQKQVDFLEANKEFALVHTAVINNKSNVYTESTWKPRHHIYSICELANDNYFYTLTALVRNIRNVNEKLNNIIVKNSNLKAGDHLYFMLAAEYGRIKFLNEITGVYRIHEGGAWTSNSEVQKLEVRLSVVNIFINIFKHNVELSSILVKKRKEIRRNYYEMKVKIFLKKAIKFNSKFFS